MYLLLANAFFQYATQTTRFIWSSYAQSQTPAGIVCINATFGLSILCGMTAGIWQGCAEGGVRDAARPQHASPFRPGTAPRLNHPGPRLTRALPSHRTGAQGVPWSLPADAA